jgi:hypothetical protein
MNAANAPSQMDQPPAYTRPATPPPVMLNLSYNSTGTTLPTYNTHHRDQFCTWESSHPILGPVHAEEMQAPTYERHWNPWSIFDQTGRDDQRPRASRWQINGERNETKRSLSQISFKLHCTTVKSSLEVEGVSREHRAVSLLWAIYRQPITHARAMRLYWRFGITPSFFPCDEVLSILAYRSIISINFGHSFPLWSFLGEVSSHFAYSHLHEQDDLNKCVKFNPMIDHA